MKAFAGYIFDLDGTVYLGERLKPIQTREHYAAKLNRLGVPVAVDDVINSSAVMVHYLARRAPGATLYVVGEEPLLDELRWAGFHVVEDPSAIGWKVDFVAAAFDRTFDYAKLNRALQAIKRGARLVATNPDRTCPVEEGDVRELPDCAGMIGAIEGVSGVKVEETAGKPSPLMIEAALARLGLPAADCLLAGDRLETDIVMGKLAGLGGTALVLTGVSTREMLAAAPVRPDYVLESLAQLAEE